MKIIVPMAGSGNRFIQQGYTEPKPLIKINDINSKRTILQHVLDMFQDPSDKFVFICNNVHLETTKMREIILEMKPNSHIISMPQHKLGPVFTVKSAFNFIEDEEEVIIS